MLVYRPGLPLITLFIWLTSFITSMDRNINKNTGIRKTKSASLLRMEAHFPIVLVSEVLGYITGDTKTWEKSA